MSEAEILQLERDKWGFKLGLNSIRQAMLLETAKERKEVRAIDKEHRDLEKKLLAKRLSASQYINTVSSILATRQELTNQIAEKSKPYRAKINPLSRVIQGIDLMIFGKLNAEKVITPLVEVTPEYHALIEKKKKKKEE